LRRAESTREAKTGERAEAATPRQDTARGLAPRHVKKGARNRADCVTRLSRRPVRAYPRSMARLRRLLFAGAIYHVTTRGNRGQVVFLDDLDRTRFLELLDDIVKRFAWICHAYCLMDNHYHLVIETPDANLSAGMHRLNGLYAQRFNRRHNVEGHLFERRFHSELVTSNAHLLELSRYVPLNPLRAGMCRDAAGYRWSSFRATVGDAPRPRFLKTDWLLSQFGRTPEEAREAFRRFVHDAPARAGP
jgi:putative transposase